MYVCISFESGEEISTPIVTLISDYSKEDVLLDSQLNYIDDKRRCITTSGLWSHQRTLTRIELAGDGTDAKGNPLQAFKVTLEVNMGQTVLRALVYYKWLILKQIICLLTLRASALKILKSIFQ